MNYVEPIRDPEKVKLISTYLKQVNERDYIMLMIGIYSGLRISDILRLRIKDILNKDTISIREKKTKKQKIFSINPLLKKEIKCYCASKDPNDYIIKSREGKNKPISREMAYKILNNAGKAFGLANIGTHTLRKTFGYHHYMQYKDVVLLQNIFNHSSPTVTLRYIGYEQERINSSIKNFKIF